jgi:hypothetical protein
MSQAMLDAVRGECSARTWSRGVELARRGAVVLLRQDPSEALLRVQVVGRAVSPTVRLFPGDEDWSCDCRGAEDPCEHVAAAVIAWRRGLEERPGEATPTVAPRAPARVGYRLTRERAANGSVGLALQRVVVDAAGEHPLQQPLVRTSTSDGRAALRFEIAASRADLAVELALGGPRRVGSGRLPATTLREVLAALREGEDLTLDGQPVRVGDPRPALRAVVTEASGGWLLRVEPDPAAGEAFDNGALLDGTTLHPRSEPTLTAGELERLRQGRHLAASEGTWLASELLPRLQAELPVQVQSSRLPRAEQVPPRLQVELTRDRDTLVALATIVYGRPPAARVVDGRLVAAAGAPRVPLRDLEEELRLARWLQRATPLRTGHRERLATAAALPLLAALRAARDVELLDAGEAVARWLAPTAPLVPCVVLSAEGFRCDFTVAGGAGAGQGATGVAAGERRVAAGAVLAAWEQGQQWLALDGGGLAPLPHDWLERYGLRDAGIGAVLADDMGLGKTLQTICALRGRSLVVAPRSVLHNWADEVRALSPGLSIARLSRRGSPSTSRGRHAHHLRGAAPRRRGARQGALGRGRARRGAGHQEPRQPGRARGLPAARELPRGALRHARGEPPRGAVEPDALRQPGAARGAERLRRALREARRGGRRHRHGERLRQRVGPSSCDA